MLLRISEIAAQGSRTAASSLQHPLPASCRLRSSPSRFLSSSHHRLSPPPPLSPRPALDNKRTPRSDGKPSIPTQRWSNRTLIMLASLVGALTYVMGVNNGYNQGKKQGVLDAQLANKPPPVSPAALRTQPDVPAAVMTPM